jgi:all-trans-retinol dehydrogenase (NAD+)
MARFRLDNRLVLVTGAARGLGLGMAREFAARGARLVLWDMDGATLAAAAAGLERDGLRVHTGVVDLTDRAAVEAAALRVLSEQGPVDVLVNNAGVVSGRPLLDLSDRDIERTFAVNTLALFWTTRAFLPAMIDRGFGHVVTVASAGGLVGIPRLVDYCASKFAAVGFDEALRTEMATAGHRIGTTVVCPFYVDTGMFEGARTRVPWLLPVLRPDVVVRRTVRAVERGRRRVILPRFAYLAFPLRLLPVAWFDRIMAWMGLTRSMEGFRGRG